MKKAADCAAPVLLSCTGLYGAIFYRREECEKATALRLEPRQQEGEAMSEYQVFVRCSKCNQEFSFCFAIIPPVIGQPIELLPGGRCRVCERTDVILTVSKYEQQTRP